MAQQILNIPTDALGLASCDPQTLVRLSLTSRQFHSTISLPYFATRCVQELLRQGAEIFRDCTSFESMALALAVDKLCNGFSRNYFFFAYGGGTNILEETRPLLDGAASLSLKHKNVQLHIDSHVGNRCPSGIARSTSLHRSHAIVRAFLDKGIEKDRLGFKAWGKKVSMVWSEPEDDAAARSELYFVFEGKYYPQRPEYYDLVPEEDRPVIANPRQVAAFDSFPDRVARVTLAPPIQQSKVRKYIISVIDSFLVKSRQAKTMTQRYCRCQRRLSACNKDD